MTDEEYRSFLEALGRIHLRRLRVSLEEAESIRCAFGRVAGLVRLWRRATEADANGPLLHQLLEELGQSLQDLERIMDKVGMLDALDDTPSILFGQFRKSAIPPEEKEILRSVGFTDDEVEIFLAVAVDRAHVLASSHHSPRSVIEHAEKTLRGKKQLGLTESSSKIDSRKKRKPWSAIGKLLGGSAAGIGNALALTGTIIAPNPATLYATIASGGIAVTALFAGIGELLGE
jgi:hypothetical protein